MITGLKATFGFLGKTENEAAVEILIAGLDSPYQFIRDESLRALLDHRSPAANQAVFHRLPAMDDRAKAIINQRPDRLVRVVAEAAQDTSAELCQSACEAIVSCRLYDALPTLVSILTAADNRNKAPAAGAMLKLTERFYTELSGNDDSLKPVQQENLRRRLTACLENAVRKFHRHKQPEAVEALLLLAKRHNVVLRGLLQRPDESSYQTVIEVLSRSQRGGVIRLLLYFLDDPRMPLAVLKVIAGRRDLKFVKNLLDFAGSHPSKVLAETLQRFDGFAWAQPGERALALLDEDAQAAAVHLLMASSMDRSQILDVLANLLLEGKPGGRRAAAKALAEFQGPKADSLAMQALNDKDPQVRAHVLVQLRPRKLPGAMSLLIDMVGSPSAEIRQALQKALPEFTFEKFLANFDAMDEPVRVTAGHMVTKIDPHSIPLLVKELHSLSPVHRCRAVLMAVAMGVVGKLERRIIRLLSDEDHIVRIAAAKALAECKTLPTWDALRDAMLDRSVIVQEAAEESLQQISQSLLHQVTPATDEQPQEIAP